MKKFNITLWIICIAVYIFNIVLIAIQGATVSNNIIAWIICIFLALCIIFDEISKTHTIKYYKQIFDMQDMYIDMLKDELKQKERKEGGE